MHDVLIAEDEVWIRSAIGEMVEKLGTEFRVVGEVGNGEQAWELIQESWPTIVITDIIMPRKNGLWLAEQIYERELPMATIIISGYDNFQYAKSAMRFGISEYLLKPVNEEELHEALRRSVHRLAGMSDVRATITQFQELVDALPELAPADATQRVEELADRTLGLKSAARSIRLSMLAMFSGRLGGMLRDIDPGYAGEPFPGDGEREAAAHFRQLAEAWIMVHPQYANPNVKMAIRQVLEHVDKHYAQNLSLAEAADMAHLSVSYFSTLFKKMTGLTFLNYVNQLRIDKAKKLLLDPEMKIYEVAERVGFASLPYFNRVFKHIVSATPLEYRKKHGI